MMWWLAALLLAVGTVAQNEQSGQLGRGPPCDGRHQLSFTRNFPSEPCANLFWACPPGVPNSIERHCAGDLTYDLETDECLARENNPGCPGGVRTTTAEFVPAVSDVPAFPFDCSYRRSGDYQHPDTPCSQQYASCVAGQVYYRHCQANLYYDVISGSCLNKEWVKTCGGQSTPRPAPTTPAPFDDQGIVCRPEGDYFVPNPSDACSQIFYSCSNGVLRQMHCAVATVFDVISEQCLDRSYTAACPGGAPTTTAQAPPSDGADHPPVDYDCAGVPDGNYETAACAALFATCSNGVAYGYICPGNLRFSQSDNQCLPAHEVDGCPDSAVPVGVCEGKPDGFYPVPGSCSEYALCQAQEPFLQVCGPNTVFHPTRGQCMDASEVPAPCGTQPPADDFNCDGLSVGYYTANNCQTYYLCEEDGSAWVFDCRPGYAFDTATETCRPQIEVPGCFVQTTLPPTLDSFCASRANGLHAYPDNCRFGIACLTNTGFLLPCPTAELPRFDPETLNCGPPTDDCQASDENTETNVQIAPDVLVDGDGNVVGGR